MNTKANGLNPVLSVGLLFAVAVAVVFTTMITTSFTDSIEANDALNQESKNVATKNASGFTWSLDLLVLFGYVAALFSVVATGYMTATNPFMAVIGIFIVVMMVAIPLAFMDGWEEFTDKDSVRSAAQQLPVTDFIMSNYAYLAVAASVLGVLAGVIR